MSFFKPTFRHPESPKNSLGLTTRAYEGGISTLCAGCGHDSISAAIMQAVWGLSIEPHRMWRIANCTILEYRAMVIPLQSAWASSHMLCAEISI